MTIRLEGRVALVTGAGRGIGEAIARTLAAAGARVAALSRTEANAQQVAHQIREAGGEALAIAADVADASAVEKAIETVLERWERLDILVNNAGITRDTLLLRMKDEDWDRVLEVNLRGAFIATRAALKPMLRQRWGRILNISSVVGLTGNIGQANYVASKAALIGFTRTIALEVGSRNITCNAIAPGLIETDMTRALSEQVREYALQRIRWDGLAHPTRWRLGYSFYAANLPRTSRGRCSSSTAVSPPGCERKPTEEVKRMDRELFERVRKVIVEQLDVREEEVTPDASFTDDLGADSLDLVELVMAFEQEFDVSIAEEEAEQVRTVADAVRLLAEKLQVEG
jgi:3-oxoacyl-[acyl-carrier protein] reductase